MVAAIPALRPVVDRMVENKRSYQQRVEAAQVRAQQAAKDD